MRMMPRAVPIPVRMLQATRPSCLRGGHVADMSAAWPWGGSDQAARRPDVAQHDCEHDEGEDGRDRREGHPPLDPHDDVLVDDRVRDKRQIHLQRRAAPLLTAGCCLQHARARREGRDRRLWELLHPPLAVVRPRLEQLGDLFGTCLGRVVDVSRACRLRGARRPARRTTRACRRTPCRWRGLPSCRTRLRTE